MTEPIPQERLDMVKRELNVTWTDGDTDAKILSLMADAEEDLHHRLGCETVDFFQPGLARRIYMAYLLYAWNNALEEFDKAYRADVMRLRHKYEVMANAEG